ncbi:hypothetical protein BGZ65_006663 [Modicella reniformis]|uniref:FAD-binding domain-containing protein n=1 Tax=Modicella reniformis TaxID=1440133 RepID=A0A9P6J5I9_9FUNG|nr:hypothetical protein BGZ65_006663 [Modicella reniformis]
MASIPSPSKSTEIPVLISGAGPVGTLAAIMLTRLGVPCRLIERELAVSPMSKALSVHARTLEILEQTGLIDRFLAKGHPISHFNVYFSGVLSNFPGLANSVSHYNYALFLEQVKTTAILNDELENQGMKVDRGWELMDTKVVEENGKSWWVETTIRRALDGTNVRATESKVLGVVELDAEQVGKEYETEVVRSEYLIAADGGKSVVRHKVNIPFSGRTLANNVILFDGHIESDLDLTNITVINGRNNQTMNVFPLNDGQHRVMVDGSDLDPTQELTNEALEKVAQAAAAPSTFRVKSSSWLTFYRVNERQAATYSYKNRIFLAGDAAHVHSPAGGQGMNLGLQDAYNLTWKMALVLNQLADASILDTYESERAPVAKNVIQMSAAMFATGFSCQLHRRAIRKLITTIFLRFVTLPSARIAMLTIRYHENMVNQRHKIQSLPLEEFQVGQRAHDGPLARILAGGQKSEELLRLHQLIDGPGTFHILVFTSDLLSVTNSNSSRKPSRDGITLANEAQLKKDVDHYLQAWRAKWALGSTRFQQEQQQSKDKRPLFKIHVIGALAEVVSGPDYQDPSKIQADSLASANTGEGRLYFDKSSILHECYGVTIKDGAGAIVVVRPDSHLGYRVQGAGSPAWQDVDEYLHSIFNRRS